MNITLHIERLTVDEGLIGHHQRMILQSAVETELARLFVAGGLSEDLQSGAALPSIQPLSIQTKVISSPKEIGCQIAHAVYGGIGK